MKQNTAKQPLEDGKDDILAVFISEIKNEFKDENWDYLDFIADRVREKTTQPDSKEGLHTQGEWHVNYTQLLNMYSIHEGCRLVAIMYSENPTSKEEAELIVKAVNERKALQKKNNDLGVNLEACKAANKVNLQTLNNVSKELSELKNERKALLDSLDELLKELKKMADSAEKNTRDIAAFEGARLLDFSIDRARKIIFKYENQ